MERVALEVLGAIRASTALPQTRWIDRAMPQLVEGLTQRLKRSSDRIALREFQVGFWLLRYLVLHGCEPRAVELSTSLTSAYIGILSKQDDYWLDDEIEIADLDWNLVLDRVQARAILLEPAPILRTPGEASERELHSLRRQRRTHLRLLLRLHSVCERRAREPLEHSVMRLLVVDSNTRPAWASMFSLRRSSLHPVADLHLLALLIRALDSFEVAMRERIYKRMFAAELETPALAVLADESSIDWVRDVAVRQASGEGRGSVPRDIYSWPVLIHVIERILSAGHVSVAVSVFHAVDSREALSTDREWQRRSKHLRIAIAAAQGEDLPSDPAEVDVREFELTRLFYEGYRSLYREPVMAVDYFRRYLELQPDLIAARINLFIANVQAAKMLEEPERGLRYRAALEDWETTASQFSSDDLEHVASGAVYCQLAALLGLNEVDRAIALLLKLPLPQRFDVAVLELLAKNASSDERVRLHVQAAHAYYGPNPPEALLALGMAPPPSTLLNEPWPIGTLRYAIDEIRKRAPDDIVRIVSRSANLGAWLLEVHARCAETLVELGGDVNGLSEDTLNALLVHAMRHSLREFGFAVEAESPGGRAGAGGAGSRGYRDWVIRHETTSIALGEALRVQGQSLAKTARENVKSHARKLLQRYNPTQVGHLFLVCWLEHLTAEAIVADYRCLFETWSEESLQTEIVERIDRTSRNPVTFKSRHRTEHGITEINHLIVSLADAPVP